MNRFQTLALSFVAGVVLVGGGWFALEFLNPEMPREDAADSVAGVAEDQDEPAVAVPAPLKVSRDETEALPDRDFEPDPPDDPPVLQGEKPRSAEIRGRVLDPSGNPVEGVEIELATGTSLVVNMPSLRNPTGIDTFTNSDGQFALRALRPAEDYIVVAKHADYGESLVGPIQLEQGEKHVVADISLQRGLKVYGFVGAGGRAVPNAVVTLENQMRGGFLGRLKNPKEREQPVFRTTTDSSGHFEFNSVAIKNFQVTVDAEGYAIVSQSNRNVLGAPSDQELNFELGPAGFITGVVLDEQQRPISDVKVSATLSGQTYRSECQTVSERDGSFVLERLAEGQYHITAEADGYSTTTKPRIQSDTTNVEIVMLPQGEVSGVVLDAESGEPVSRFDLYVLRSMNGRDPARTGVTNRFSSADGSFTFKGLDPNRYVLEARAEGYAPTQSPEFVVARGEATTGVTVRLNKGGTVTGEVVDTKGEPLANVQVQLNPNNFKWNPVHDLLGRMANSDEVKRRTRTRTDGTFQIDLIVPGTYQVSAKRAEFAPLETNDVEVVLNQTTEIGTLAMTRGGGVEGFCYDENGNILVGATVNAVSEAGDYSQAITNNEGYYTITGLRPETYTVSINNFVRNPPENVLVQMLMAKNSAVQAVIEDGTMQVVDLRLSRDKN